MIDSLISNAASDPATVAASTPTPTATAIPAIRPATGLP
jgi:hypothetical protein